jgi:hypothetical protein
LSRSTRTVDDAGRDGTVDVLDDANPRVGVRIPIGLVEGVSQGKERRGLGT